MWDVGLGETANGVARPVRQPHAVSLIILTDMKSSKGEIETSGATMQCNGSLLGRSKADLYRTKLLIVTR